MTLSLFDSTVARIAIFVQIAKSFNYMSHKITKNLASLMQEEKKGGAWEVVGATRFPSRRPIRSGARLHGD